MILSRYSDYGLGLNIIVLDELELKAFEEKITGV
jgi:hypothetical protein